MKDRVLSLLCWFSMRRSMHVLLHHHLCCLFICSASCLHRSSPPIQIFDKRDKSSFLMSAVLFLSVFINALHPNCSKYAFPSTSAGSGAGIELYSVLCSILPIVCLCCVVFACARSFVQMLFAFCGHLRFSKRAICFSRCRTKVVCLHANQPLVLIITCSCSCLCHQK